MSYIPEVAARFLTTAAGEQFLTAIAQLPANDLQRIQQVSRWDLGEYLSSLTPEEVASFSTLLEPDARKTLTHLALSVATARRKAGDRFDHFPYFEGPLYFTEEMLAQASSPAIAQHHAFGMAGRSVTDLGCGAGIDSIAFANLLSDVVAVDYNPVHVAFAEANARSAGMAEKITFHQADAVDFAIRTEYIFADPARRTDAGVRVSRHADLYSPSLAILVEKIKQVRGGGMKLSPLLSDDFLLSLGGRVEFLSEARECKEACVWFGDAGRNGMDAPISACFVGGGGTLVPDESPVTVRPVGEWIYEPDPAIIRAGAVATAAERLDAGFISAEDVYLTSDALHSRTPLARSYRVVEAMPFHRKEVAAFVRKAGYGRVVVKKRRARMEPEAVLQEIGASNKGPLPEIILILIREAKGHTVVFCTQSLAESRNAYL